MGKGTTEIVRDHRPARANSRFVPRIVPFLSQDSVRSFDRVQRKSLRSSRKSSQAYILLVTTPIGIPFENHPWLIHIVCGPPPYEGLRWPFPWNPRSVSDPTQLSLAIEEMLRITIRSGANRDKSVSCLRVTTQVPAFGKLF